MKAVSLRLLSLILLLVSFFAAGCSQESEEKSAYHVYYLNKEITKIVGKAYEPEAEAKDTNAMIDELLMQLATDSGDVNYNKPIPNDVEVMDYSLEGTLLTLYFDNDYSSMDRITEVLVRAAIVRTMMQVDGVECLTFYVGESPLSDQEGNPIGVMTAESFVENPGEQINSIQTAVLALYFANSEGNALVKETQEVHYSSNISLEKLVMEYLLAGPEGDDAQSAIPSGTKLVNVSVLDGVCYVNLDDVFLNQDYSIEEPIVMYSIINSLSELSTISKVQISVNGDTSGVYRDSFPLDELYERNLDYVMEVENKVE